MTASLEVNRSELVQALRVIKRMVKRNYKGDAILTVRDGGLDISIGGVHAGASASGKWPGQVRVSGSAILGLAQNSDWYLPAGDAVQFTVNEEGGRVRVGIFSFKCVCELAVEEPVELPINVALPQVLSLRYTRTEEEIQAAGLAKVLEATEERRDRLIEKAVAILEPLGVRPCDLLLVVQDAVRRVERLPR